MKEKEREHGQAAILLALGLVGLIAFAALAIDGGNAYFMRRNSQNASDAGAYAGAREVFIMRHLPLPTCTATASEGVSGTTCLLMVIHEQAERNGVPDTDGEPFDEFNDNVEVHYVDAEGKNLAEPLEPEGEKPGVEVMGVRVSTTIHFDTFIAGIIGRSEMAATTTAATLLTDKINAVNHAIWADSTCTLGTVCTLTGDFQMVDGGIHSNAELKIEPSGDGSVYTGTLEYVTEPHYVNLDKIDLYPTSTVTSPNPSPVEPRHLPLLFDITDYITPTGTRAISATLDLDADGNSHYYYYPDDGTGNTPTMIMAPGLHYSAHPNGLNMGKEESSVPMAITVVTSGTVTYQIPAAAVSLLYPYVDGLLIFSTRGGRNCPTEGVNDTAISMSVSNARWEGFIYGPNGLVTMSFSDNTAFFGSIVGWEVSISGSDFQLTYDPLYDPDWDPRVTLFE